MKAVVIEQYGGSEVMDYRDVKRADPLPNEVEVEVSYAGINPVDWQIREGMLKTWLPTQFPVILGWDVSGVIARIGSEVREWKVGDEVYAYARKSEIHRGTYAEYICLDQNNVSTMPINLIHREAAVIPLAALTAWQSLVEAAEIKRGQNVLIHAGAGGVGSMAIQIAKYFGAKVFVTASEKNRAYVTELGADVVIDYTKQNFADALIERVPEGMDIVFDTVGDETLESSYTTVKKNGTLVSICAPPDEEKAKTLGIRVKFVFVRPEKKHLDALTKLIEEGRLVPPFIEDFPLQEAAIALEKQKTGHVRGKLVLGVHVH